MENRSYFGCKVTQRIDNETVPFFVFHTRVRDALQWVGIKRSREYEEGTQRILRESRRKAIARFLARDSVNTIPNNILLAFEPNQANFRSVDQQMIACFNGTDIHNECSPQVEWGFLEFSFEHNQPDHLRPALIVDGQHRFFGMSDFDQENLPILFVCLIDAPLKEQAFQFIVINSKAVRVPADNAKAIIEGVDEDALRDRLLKVGVKYAGISPLLSEVNDLQNSPFLLIFGHELGQMKR
ncbi:MAG: DGQHR domain-containing protein [Anaerolineaceae bacterium]|nr:DGQHR domain-containing protein [Anaerolineaceae bacterium]